jgi:hypothetical protein
VEHLNIIFPTSIEVTMADDLVLALRRRRSAGMTADLENEQGWKEETEVI